MKFKFFILFIILSISVFQFSNSLNKKSSKRRNSAKANILPRNEKNYKKSTFLSGTELGSVYSLRDKQVSCFNEKGAISGFHVFGKNGWISNDIGIEYNCIENKIINQNKFEYKSFQSIKKGDILSGTSPNLLTNIEVNCKDGFISEFTLKKDWFQIYYDAKCVNLPIKKGSCKTEKSNQINPRDWLIFDSVSKLDQIPVNSPNGKALVSFKLVNINKNIYYEFNACEIDNDQLNTINTESNNIVSNAALKAISKNNDNPDAKLRKLKRRRY